MSPEGVGAGDQASQEGRAIPGWAFPRSVGNALRGLAYAYRTEPHVRFHLVALVGALAAARAVHLAGWELAYLLLTALLVIAAELVNTAIERAVDLAAAGRLQPLAGQAKDVAAGGVLLVAIHALWAGLWLFGLRRGLLRSALETLALLIDRPWWGLLLILVLVGWIWGGRPKSRQESGRIE